MAKLVLKHSAQGKGAVKRNQKVDHTKGFELFLVNAWREMLSTFTFQTTCLAAYTTSLQGSCNAKRNCFIHAKTNTPKQA